MGTQPHFPSPRAPLMHKIHRLNSSASTVAPAAVPRFNDCWGCQSCSLVLTRCSITKSGQWIQLVRLGLEAGSTDRPTPRCPAPKRGQGGLHPPRQQWCRQRPLSAEDEGPCLNPGGGLRLRKRATRAPRLALAGPSIMALWQVKEGSAGHYHRSRAAFLRISRPGHLQQRTRLSRFGTRWQTAQS